MWTFVVFPQRRHARSLAQVGLQLVELGNNRVGGHCGQHRASLDQRDACPACSGYHVCCCRDDGVQRGFAALLSLHLHGEVTQ